MKKNVPILGIAIALIIFIRCIFTNNGNVVYIVAALNIIACVFVLYSITWKIVRGIKKRIEDSGVPIQIQDREKRKISIRIWLIVTGISTVLVILYYLFFCSALGNDIISILALGFSILDDEIVESLCSILEC